MVGELDLASQSDMKAFFTEVAACGEDLVLDVSDLTFIDVFGLRCLLELADSLTDSSKLILQSPSAEVRRMMDAAPVNRRSKLAIRDSA